MKIHPILASLSSVLLLSACAGTPPGQYQFDNSKQFAASYDRTWEAVIDTFASSNIPIQTVEKDSGLIVAETSFGVDEQVADCGTPGVYDLHQNPHVSYNVFVRRMDEDVQQVTVNTRFGMQVRSTWDGSIKNAECASRGTLEKAILTGIESRL